MTRRKFILILSTGAAVVGFYIYFVLHRMGTSANAVWIPGSLMNLMDKNTILDIGETYCAKTPEEGFENILWRHLGITGGQYSVDESTMTKLIKKDFSSGNIRIINGWVLSVTEVRQCALFHLQSLK